MEQSQIHSDEAEFNCPTCGYNLRGLTSPKCPECGNEFDPHKLKRRVRDVTLPVIVAGASLIAVIFASHMVSWMIQRVGWPATSGPRAREWIVHEDNVSQVPSYIPLTVWLPMGAAGIALLIVGLWLKRRLQRAGRDADLIIATFAVIATGLLIASYGCMHWTALCCD